MTKRKFGLLWIVVSSLSLAACSNYPIGSGPIELGPRGQAFYDQYRRSGKPIAFVINKRGQAFTSYCAQMDCRGGSVASTLQRCRQAQGGDCYVYDIGGKVVWRDQQ
jgi:hypothetical protein